MVHLYAYIPGIPVDLGTGTLIHLCNLVKCLLPVHLCTLTHLCNLVHLSIPGTPVNLSTPCVTWYTVYSWYTCWPRYTCIIWYTCVQPVYMWTLAHLCYLVHLSSPGTPVDLSTPMCNMVTYVLLVHLWTSVHVCNLLHLSFPSTPVDFGTPVYSWYICAYCNEEVILVTGGAGFLGQHVVRLLQERTTNVAEIRVFDTRPYRNKLGKSPYIQSSAVQ